MKEIAYLILSKRGTVGLRKNSPSLARGEIAVRLELDVPDSLFRDYIPTARLSIEADQVVRPEPTVRVLVPEDVLDGYSEEAVWASLVLVMQPAPSKVEITDWDMEQRREAVEWATAEHLAASDNPVQRLPMPEWLKVYTEEG
jgi:hypothetical protein